MLKLLILTYCIYAVCHTQSMSERRSIFQKRAQGERRSEKLVSVSAKRALFGTLFYSSLPVKVFKNPQFSVNSIVKILCFLNILNTLYCI